jgi:hypothetical protein
MDVAQNEEPVQEELKSPRRGGVEHGLDKVSRQLGWVGLEYQTQHLCFGNEVGEREELLSGLGQVTGERHAPNNPPSY